MIKMRLVPPTTERVQLHTKKQVNEIIHEKTKNNIKFYQTASKDDLIERLDELNHEWDTERVLETNASIFILIGAVLTFTLSIYWLIFIIVVSFFLLVHAVIGWCPPLPVIRRLGIRTEEEIENEKAVIKYMLGDFNNGNSLDVYEKINKD